MKYTTRGNRASIMTTTMTVEVLCKEQFVHLVGWLVEQEYHFEFETTDDGNKYSLTVIDLPWMANVEELAKKFKEFDYTVD